MSLPKVPIQFTSYRLLYLNGTWSLSCGRQRLRRISASFFPDLVSNLNCLKIEFCLKFSSSEQPLSQLYCWVYWPEWDLKSQLKPKTTNIIFFACWAFLSLLKTEFCLKFSSFELLPISSQQFLLLSINKVRFLNIVLSWEANGLFWKLLHFFNEIWAFFRLLMIAKWTIEIVWGILLSDLSRLGLCANNSAHVGSLSVIIIVLSNLLLP